MFQLGEQEGATGGSCFVLRFSDFDNEGLPGRKPFQYDSREAMIIYQGFLTLKNISRQLDLELLWNTRYVRTVFWLSESWMPSGFIDIIIDISRH